MCLCSKISLFVKLFDFIKSIVYSLLLSILLFCAAKVAKKDCKCHTFFLILQRK